MGLNLSIIAISYETLGKLLSSLRLYFSNGDDINPYPERVAVSRKLGEAVYGNP